MNRKKKFWPEAIILVICLFFSILYSCKEKRKTTNIVDVVLHSDDHINNKEANQLFNRGLYHVEHEQYQEAKECFEKANKLYPNSPVILNAVGSSIARTENIENSFPYFEKALLIDSDFIKTYVNYGCSLNSDRKYGTAKRILYLGLSKKIEYNIDRVGLYVNLSDSYYMLGKKSDALKYIDSAKVRVKEGDLYYNRVIEFENRIKLLK